RRKGDRRAEGGLRAVPPARGRAGTGRRAPLAASASVTRLLVRDLAQLVSPAGSGAPLRGPALADVELVEHAYVLCEDGRITSTGAMRDLPRDLGQVDELDGRGLAAIPGLVDC